MKTSYTEISMMTWSELVAFVRNYGKYDRYYDYAQHRISCYHAPIHHRT